MFVDRAAELAFLQERVARTSPRPAQLLMVYGRRRVGKTALLRHWAEQSGLPFTYWMAQKEAAPVQRRKLFAALTGRPAGQSGTPTFESWSDLWDVVAPLIRERRQIVILDEVPYAAEADSAMLSALQYAWDIHFQHGQPIIALCGSHVRMMESLLYQQSPLFGRMTGQWYLRPLPFGVLRAFFPAWSPEEQVAA